MRTINDIPKYFKVANQLYKVVLVDHLDKPEYGEFDDIKAEIRIAKRILSPYTNDFIELTEEQILNSFWHETFHCFNWHYNTETDEGIAQSFANFMREFETSKDV